MPTEPIIIRNIGSSGVILDAVVDEFLMPTGAVSWAVNGHFDRIGAFTTRLGITQLEEQISDNNSILGLHQFLDTGSGTNDRLIAAVSTKWSALVAGTWTDKRTGISAAKARFTNFVDMVFGVNGVDAMASWDGGAGNFVTNTNVTSAPAATYIENFRTRVWAARTTANPSRLYYSSIANASYAIVWTGGGGEGFIDIAPLDGEDISGLKKFGTALYVFKPSTVYRIFSISESEPDPVIFTGTYSQESINVAKDGMYWHHPTGIYRMRNGETKPSEISRPVNDIIQAIPLSYYDDVSSWSDSDHVYFHIGTVSIYGITLANCVLRWTISTEVWTISAYASAFTVGATYNDGTTINLVVGDNDGNVHTFNSGTTDNGVPIFYSLETRWLAISGLRSEDKTIRRMIGLHENMQNTKVDWRNGSMGRNELQEVGLLAGQETTFKNLNIRGNRIKFSLSGVNVGAPAIFQGFEIIDWLNEGVTEISH